MKSVLILVLASIIFFISIPDVFGLTYPVNIPMGAAGGVSNYTPSTLNIEKNDIVKWTVFDRGKHTVTSDSGVFGSGTLEGNKKGSSCYPDCKPFVYTFNEGGTYNYHCQFHPWMHGSVVVKDLGYNASVKDCTNVGCVYLDKQRYGVSEGRTVLVEIYGKVNDSSNNDFVYLSIKEPSGKLTEHKIPITSSGDFVYPLPISYDKRGMYAVIVRGEYNPNGDQLGSIWFEVVKGSGISQLKDVQPTSIILTTDLPRYEKNSTIAIAGQLLPYQSGSIEVTIQIIFQNGNLIDVAQLQPNSAGKFSTTFNTSNWSNPGAYEIKARYGDLVQSTTLHFVIPSNPTSKTSTFLKLDPIDNVFTAGLNSQANVVFSGQLLTSDRDSYITDAKIQLIDTRFNESITVKTDNNGKFHATWKWSVGNNYGVYAFYDGSNSLKFESSTSKTESFRVVGQTATQPQSSTQSSGVAGMEWIMILIPVIIIAVVAIAIKSRKKTPIAPLAQQPRKRRTRTKPSQSSVRQPSGEAASTFRHFECPTCHSDKIVQNSNGSEYCPDCGWQS